MSTSFIFHAYGMVGYQYLSTTYTNGKVIFRVQKNPYKTICSCCQSSNFIRKGKVQRMFKAVPIGKKPVFLEVVIQRILCLGCGSLKQEKLSFADSRKTYTHTFERYALELSKLMTIQDVALHLGISWDTVKEIQKQFLLKNFGKPKLKHLTYLAIDEISIGKHHRYLTVVLDLVTGAVVFVGEGKKAESLSPFWKRLKSPAYIDALQTHLPQTTVVFDHFHIIKYYNDKLSLLRRDLYREITDSLEKNILKGTRWLLLKNPENLDETKNEHDQLKKALQINQPLANPSGSLDCQSLLFRNKNT